MAKQAFGMSKMTVADEFRAPEVRGSYHQIEFVEFLEVICRVAVLKFKGSDLANQSISMKILYVLDEILRLVDLKH